MTVDPHARPLAGFCLTRTLGGSHMTLEDLLIDTITVEGVGTWRCRLVNGNAYISDVHLRGDFRRGDLVRTSKGDNRVISDIREHFNHTELVLS